jgi:hypothetical protein
LRPQPRAPSACRRPSPKLDLLFQGKSNSLDLYRAADPATAIAPTFTGGRIGPDLPPAG